MTRSDKKQKEYSWLDDPFVEKPEESQQQGMGSSTKLFIGCGCLVVLVALVVLIVLFFAGLSGLMN